MTAPYSTSSSALIRTIFSFWFSRRSLILVGSSFSVIGFAFRYSVLSRLIATTVCPDVSGLSVVLPAFGSVTATPCCSSGATIIMMMSSTSMTSQSGVTLISDLTPPLAPPRSIAITDSWVRGTRYPLDRLANEVVDELRRGVVHLHVEVLDAARQVVIEPHRRNRDDEAERGLDERLRDTARDGADAARAAGRDAFERLDDADDRAEQSDEGRRRSDGRERRDALLEVRRGERGGALNRQIGRA